MNPAPAQRSPASRPGRRRRWPWILLIVAVVLVGCGVAAPIVAVFGVATAADKGADCPSCAATAWITVMGSLWWNTDGELRAEKSAAPDHRSSLMAQRRAYIDQIRADAHRYPAVAGADFDPHTGTAPHTDVQGETAIVVLHVAARWPNTTGNGAPWMYSSTADW